MVKDLGVPKYAIDAAMVAPKKPVGITKKRMPGGCYNTKRGGVDACPEQYKGACCGGTKEWGLKDADGKGNLDKASGDTTWFCYACGWELDIPTNPPAGSKARMELNRRAALKRQKDRAAMAARIADARSHM